MHQVTGLTQRERVVLLIVAGLFLVGWTAKFWRQAQGRTVQVEAVVEE